MNMDLFNYVSQIVGSFAAVSCAGVYLSNVEIIRVLCEIHPITGPMEDRRRVPLSFTVQGDIIALIHSNINIPFALELRSI